MAVRRIDLNLFRVFEAVLEHRSVRVASEELGVTASAVSHALSRLRQALRDELFVLTDAGMEPTPRALELAPGIRDGLVRIEAAISNAQFDPSKTVRVFRVAASDYLSTTVLVPTIGQLHRVAPQVDLRIFPFSHLDVVRHLDEGRIDLVLGWFRHLPDRVRRAPLFTESETVIVRTGHPLTTGPVTTERLLSFPHIVVELTGTEERAIDGFVDERGVSRRVWIERLLIETGNNSDQGPIGRVAVTVPHYSIVPALVRGTDMAASFPRLAADLAVAQGGLVSLELPYDPLRVPVEVVWHQRADRDSGVQWLIAEVTKAMHDVRPSPP